MSAPVIIVGVRHAGSELAAALRKFQSQQPVNLIGEEPYLP